jgi:MraZ protein
VPLFVGEFEQTIDAKHRLAIPMALREQMDPEDDGSNFILVLGPDRHLWLYPDQWYRRLLASLRRSPLPDRESGRIDFLFAMARIVKPDKQGRVVLPERSMQRAQIDDCVTLVGGYDHIVIWPTATWEQRVAQQLETYPDVMYDVAERLRDEMA